MSNKPIVIKKDQTFPDVPGLDIALNSIIKQIELNLNKVSGISTPTTPTTGNYNINSGGSIPGPQGPAGPAGSNKNSIPYTWFMG